MSWLFQRTKNGSYYLGDRHGDRTTSRSLRTRSLQIAKEKQRRYDSAKAQGADNPLPTRTPIAHILDAYVDHIRATKTAKSAQTEIYYLREAFGECCAGVRCTSRTRSVKARKRKPKRSSEDRRRTLPVIEAPCFEAITAAQIGQFIDFKVRDQGLKPKTANHYRSIIRRVFNWATETDRVRLPNNLNPATRVRPYKEPAPVIRYLTLAQIDEQLHALRFKPRLQMAVAVLIYAGLRREELLWLTIDDLDLSRRHGGHGMIRVRAKTIDGQSWQPKTKRNRAVPISFALRTYLDRYTVPASDFARVFPSPEGRRWDPDNFSGRHLAEAQKSAGLPWTCLDFRHTFGSQLAQRGVSLYEISALMGNSPEICRRHYAALVPEAMAAHVEFGEMHNFSAQTA